MPDASESTQPRTFGAGLRQLAALAVSWVLMLPVSPVLAGDRGAEQFSTCALCHGPDGRGNQKLEAPAIAGLPQWYIEAQLKKFRTDVRGAHPADYRGVQMRSMAKTIYEEGDVALLAAYVASLPASPAASTLQGDVEKGKATFAVCQACHGDKAQGNEVLKAPPLRNQHDWYMLSQLTRFKGGIRGAHKDDVSGAQMRGIANTLQDEQVMRNVVTYINTLAQ